MLADGVALAGLEQDRKSDNSLCCSCQILLISISFSSWTSVNPSAASSGFPLSPTSSRAFFGGVGGSGEAARLAPESVNNDAGAVPISRGKPYAIFYLIQAVVDGERGVGAEFSIDAWEAATPEPATRGVLTRGGASLGCVVCFCG